MATIAIIVLAIIAQLYSYIGFEGYSLIYVALFIGTGINSLKLRKLLMDKAQGQASKTVVAEVPLSANRITGPGVKI